MKCRRCGAPTMKVLYMGLPARLCSDDSCSTLDGGLSRAITWLPFNGWFFAYEGGYWPALWRWLFGRTA